MNRKLLHFFVPLLFVLTCVIFVACKPSLKELPAPQNLEIFERVITWDKVDGAIGYTVFVNDEEYEVSETSFSLLSITEGTYYINVMAVGDGEKHTNSVATSLTFNLHAPKPLLKDEKGLYYSLLPDGTGYEVTRGKNSVNSESLSGTIVIPDFVYGYPVKSIGVEAFSLPVTESDCFTEVGCNKVTTGLVLPRHLETIKNGAFRRMVNLKEVVIPESVKDIEGGAFEGCKRLTSVVLPSGLKDIKMFAFRNTALKSLDLPDGLQRIEPFAFACPTDEYEETFGGIVVDHISSELSFVEIPASVKEIHYCAFQGRENLKDISILSHDFDIFDNAVFADTAWYKSHPEGIMYLDHILYGYKGEMPVDTTLTVPENIEFVAGEAFLNQANLAKVVLPDGLKFIGRFAFNGCTSLKEVIFSNSLTAIGDYAFGYTSNLTEINLPSSLKQIGMGAFSGSGLVNLVFPNGLEKIGVGAFAMCNALEKVTLPDALKTLERNAFSNCSSLKKIVIPSGIESIERDTILNCKALEVVYFKGTQTEWNTVVGADNFLYNDKMCFYSQTQPTEEGNYWHYVNGEIVLWTKDK